MNNLIIRDGRAVLELPPFTGAIPLAGGVKFSKGDYSQPVVVSPRESAVHSDPLRTDGDLNGPITTL